MNGVVCCGFGVCGSESRVCHGVSSLYVGANSGCCAFACVSAGFCWLFKCGSVRVVKGVWILETQKEGKKSIPKGREAEVTSTVSLFSLLVNLGWPLFLGLPSVRSCVLGSVDCWLFFFRAFSPVSLSAFVLLLVGSVRTDSEVVVLRFSSLVVSCGGLSASG